MLMPFHREQLDFMVALSKHRIEALDPFFRFLNYFDTEYFFFALIPLIWFGISYKWGLRIFYLLFINSILIHFFKHFFGWPRPSTDLSEIGMFHFADNGFPSGAAQTAMLLGGMLIFYWKNRFSWVLGIVYILLISFSRLYLGVHYPIDVLGGWIFGLCLLFLFLKFLDPFEHFLKKIGLYFSLLLAEIIPLAIIFSTSSSKTSLLMIGAVAVGIGAFFTFKYDLYLPPTKHYWVRALRILFAVASVFMIYLIWPKGVYPWIEYFFLSLWVSLAVSPILKKLPSFP